jgi:predicted  nucleic acid-binding Zn-ribbon protein
MAADVTREEFQTLEREVEGEKMVTRHILEQTRRNGDDLAAIKTRLDRVEAKLDGVDLKGLERKVDGLDKKFDRLDRKVESLTKSLPSIVGDVMREVLRERDDKC